MLHCCALDQLDWSCVQVYEELDEELQKHFEDYLAEVGRLPTNVSEVYMGWVA